MPEQEEMMNDMPQEFSFVDAGRTFTCRTEAPGRAQGEASWWWFEVSTDDRHRYAPFRADPSDTLDNVRARVVAYYDGLLARRAAPVQSRWNRRPPAPASAAPAS